VDHLGSGSDAKYKKETQSTFSLLISSNDFCRNHCSVVAGSYQGPVPNGTPSMEMYGFPNELPPILDISAEHK